MEKVSAKTKRRLIKLASIVRKNWKHFDMSNWCGSKGCVAGFAIVEFDKTVFPSYTAGLKKIDESEKLRIAAAERYGRQDFNFGLAEWAGELLEIANDQREALFIVSNWPSQFQEQFGNARSAKEEANVSAERILHMARTGE